MKKVFLSADNQPSLYAVPDAVADHLDEYCLAFWRWLETSPDAEKYRVYFDEEDEPYFGLCYTERDFIEYLNQFVFPEEMSYRIDWCPAGDWETPEEYPEIPHFNF